MGRDPSLGPHGHGEMLENNATGFRLCAATTLPAQKITTCPARRGGPEQQVVWRVLHVREEAEMSRSHEQALL
jgi:hypothetical protein